MDIAIVSPFTVHRKGLCVLLGQNKDFRVVVDAASALGNYEAIRKARPQVLVMETTGSTGDLETVCRFRKLLPETRILLLMDSAGETFEVRALKAGAWGCVSMAVSPEILTKALKAVGGGEMWVSHSLATRILGNVLRWHEAAASDMTGLTPREWEILAQVAHGYRNKEIANRLVVSENTIKAHLAAIYRKLQVDSRLGAALYYLHQTAQEEDRRDARLPASAGKPHFLPGAAPAQLVATEHQSIHRHR
jgi:two-component system nitrate/nitrite response regulator NarL